MQLDIFFELGNDEGISTQDLSLANMFKTGGLLQDFILPTLREVLKEDSGSEEAESSYLKIKSISSSMATVKDRGQII